MLRRIILENFMSHARTEIDLADGLTVLTGPNNCGKSAVVAALQILATNGRSTHVMRHGAKCCRITVETDDGHTICWERKKTTVKYTLDGEDIHRVGTSVPDSLHELLRLDRVEAETGKSKHEYDIHFGEQKAPVFLLGESGSRAASFFASSSDASRLVEMQHRHRLKLRDQKSEAKRLRTESNNNTARLMSFEPIDQIADHITQADSSLETIRAAEQRIHLLKRLTSGLGHSRTECERLRIQRSILARLDQAMTTPADLERVTQSATQLRSAVVEMSNLQQRRRDCGAQVETLATLKSVPELHEVNRIQSLIVDLAAGTQRRDSANEILDCCSPVTAPPELEPADACRRVLDQLSAASVRQRHVDRVSQSLWVLESAPHLSDTNALQAVISKLVDVARRNRTTNSAQAAFTHLRKPPEETPTDRLRQLVADLTDRQAVVAGSIAGAAALAKLSTPADPIDVDSLTATIEKLSQCLGAAAKAAGNVDAARKNTADCETQIRQFVRSNPRCATCGASIDPETLMSTVPSLHDHSVTSATSVTDADQADGGDAS
ncbi:MAG: AAA family ATPase [Fuerstiella sp.]|nr:AAA family ATPase [Fuerstiella sp.]MCP4854956.1 AAA family ATPase [Fuerstiella sp.]